MCTPEDINHLAYGLLVKDAMNHVMFPVMTDLCKSFCAMARDNAHIVMLSCTHGQASPTTLGKEMATFAFRLGFWAQRMSGVCIFGKFAGVAANYNACKIAYPDIDWPRIAQEFVTSLGLQFNPYATQANFLFTQCSHLYIESHHYMVELCNNMVNFNNVLADFIDDVRSYISLGYFEQMTKEGKSESCTMPRKLDSLDFVSCGANLLSAEGSLSAISKRISTSRRKVNESCLAEDLDKNWAVLVDAIQTVMETYAVSEPYEKLKELTKGDVNKESISSFIKNLDLPEDKKLKLLNLTPRSYIGQAEILAKLIDNALGFPFLLHSLDREVGFSPPNLTSEGEISFAGFVTSLFLVCWRIAMFRLEEEKIKRRIDFRIVCRRR
ncbi:hypothetical protein LUZ61_006680 [Rhynchospora tenuis]|uniref:Adenylosuccinate lyase n=1 Tax=Rhynchospora tenuis TaxID=198213 RepID=A0AAD5ZS49_9POAL|nr:hypothetical protein LUZ61_006680 [Rhynchospora tenuis]